MDRTQIIIYIIFGLVYLLMRVIKNRNAPKEAEEGEVEQPRPKTKPITFEDLLKELSGVEEVEKPKPQPQPVPKPLVREEAYDHPFAKTTKKKQNQGAFSYEDKPNRFEKYRDAKPLSLEEKYKTTAIKDRKDEFDSKYHKEEEHTMADDVRESLRSSSDIKKAFVLSEVLQRKF